MAASSLQDRLGSLAAQGRDAVTGAVRVWAGAVEQASRALPDPEAAVRSYFAFAEEALRGQRAFALDLLRVTRGDRPGG
jgi:hypothetical protein